jgi:hypothetical protein
MAILLCKKIATFVGIDIWFFFRILKYLSMLSPPSWDATQHDATSEKSKTFSLNAPKFLKCLFEKEWLVSNNWGLNPKPQKFAKRVHSFHENEIFFDTFPVF